MAEPWGHLLTGDAEPEAIRSWVVWPGFFEALGAQPFLGRTFLPEEYQPGPAVPGSNQHKQLLCGIQQD